MELSSMLLIALGCVLGAAAGFLLHRTIEARRLGDAKDLATRILDEARKEAQG